jgi:hypothetical protein
MHKSLAWIILFVFLSLAATTAKASWTSLEDTAEIGRCTLVSHENVKPSQDRPEIDLNPRFEALAPVIARLRSTTSSHGQFSSCEQGRSRSSYYCNSVPAYRLSFDPSSTVRTWVSVVTH